MVGEFDKALDKIEYLLSVPSPMSIPLLKLDSRWKPLMSHPRFQKLQERENQICEGGEEYFLLHDKNNLWLGNSTRNIKVIRKGKDVKAMEHY